MATGIRDFSGRLAIGFAVFVFAVTANAASLTNPIVFVTQPPIPRELNGSAATTFLSVVTIFGNHLADTAHAGRGGDLWLMLTNKSLVNLTRAAGLGATSVQHGVGISVRDPAIHWNGKKVLFSMVVGSPTSATDTSPFYWQLYEMTNLDAVIADTNTVPIIVKVPNQPASCNNVTPCYGTDSRIIFMSDKPYNGVFGNLDEYKGQPAVSGAYSLDPVTGDLKMLQHTPSGSFNPFVDSYGRLIVTRWDHLTQDPLAADDRLGRAANGAYNFLSESIGAATQSTNLIETFPEPRNFDTNYTAALGVNGNAFNFFFPWTLDEAGGNEEVLNHVGRQELLTSVAQSFTADTNLIRFNNLSQRIASGVSSANTNAMFAFFQIVEDPRTNGLYWGIQAVDISPTGGTHSSGQILTLTGGSNVNPTNMVVTSVTAPPGANQIGNSLGLYRNPLPMSDGTLIAAYTPNDTSILSGVDTNTGSALLPTSLYKFRLMTLASGSPYWTANQFLTAGISKTAIYFDGAILVTNAAVQWELQPVEVRSRNIPTPAKSSVGPIEQQVFADEGVDLATFQADLAQRNLALCISRNVTARDAADKQQPYNLRIPGGVSSIANSGKVYDITHLQFLQADYLRGYSNGPDGLPIPGRRILAVPMHSTTNVNYASSKNAAPIGGVELMSDGSQATIIPANRAVTWQLTGSQTNESVVKERYWISFRPGEIRTCANCHGINSVDQMGRKSPTNSPLALHKLLQLWRTNEANAYTLTVNNGAGGGKFGAGSIVTLAAGAAPAGKYFAGWTGASVTAHTSATTSFVMPTADATVTAQFDTLPVLSINPVQPSGGQNFTLSGQVLANQTWVLKKSANLIDWQIVATNLTSPAGLIQFTYSIDAEQSLFFTITLP
ncbi:MAG TPA: hypothetical protein VM680_07865 [Verrucomicrobiae bacterium]|nr:hypothetical protein [Verrucomicrobiae bacterium]